MISASLQASGVVFPFAISTSICRSNATICSGLCFFIGMSSSPLERSSLTPAGLNQPGQVKVTSCLLSDSAYGLLEGEKESQGISVVRGKASVLVDKSQGYANSIFVKIYREHKTETSLADIAKTLRSDESRLFDTLKVDVDA